MSDGHKLCTTIHLQSNFHQAIPNQKDTSQNNNQQSEPRGLLDGMILFLNFSNGHIFNHDHHIPCVFF